MSYIISKKKWKRKVSYRDKDFEKTTRDWDVFEKQIQQATLERLVVMKKRLEKEIKKVV